MKAEKTHTTNYSNTFIEVADDCPVEEAEIPPQREGMETAANIHFKMINENPYKYSSDDVIFQVFASKYGIKGKSQMDNEREAFFSRGQACLRASALTKRYGWGVHANAEGKVALYPLGSPEYKKMQKDKTLAHVKGMRSKKEK